VTVGFGLDLAGFSNHRGTVLAKIGPSESGAEVFLLTGSPFGSPLDGSNFADRLNKEATTLRALLEVGPLAVDVPIDLQDLPLQLQALPTKRITDPWELTKRPVDEAFDGLAPLASWLGACVARFAAIMPKEVREKELGVRLFETYPAAVLQQLFGKNDSDVEQYKLADKKKAEIAVAARLRLCRRLGLECDGAALTHDELDAVLCTFVAVATPDQWLSEKEYRLKGSKKLPDGYRLLGKQMEFQSVKVSRKPFDEWMAENGRKP
jgi:hypothetical protein